MMDPNDVNLIIFDFGGTLISDHKADYEGIKRAFDKMGWAVPFREEDVVSLMTMPSEDFFRYLAPAGEKERWREIKAKVWQEYYVTFPEYSVLFPGVKETLAELKNRGMRLAIYSRADNRIITDCCAALGITGYFDYIKAKDDDGLEKPELAKQIISRFKAAAAIVGDSAPDMQVAKDLGALAVKALYGYGGRDKGQADMTIERFSGLLTIFKENVNIK